MAFWLHESKIVLILHIVPRWCRVCISVGLLLGIGATWYLWQYLPRQKTCVQTTITIQTLEQRNAFLAKIIQHKPKLEHDKSVLDQKLNSLKSCSIFDDQIMIETLLAALKKYDISCKELKPLDIKRGLYWQKHPFNLTFKGSFKDIKSFMNDLFTQQKFVTCNTLSLTRLKKHKIKGEMKVTFITFGDYEDKQVVGSL